MVLEAAVAESLTGLLLWIGTIIGQIVGYMLVAASSVNGRWVLLCCNLLALLVSLYGIKNFHSQFKSSGFIKAFSTKTEALYLNPLWWAVILSAAGMLTNEIWSDAEKDDLMDKDKWIRDTVVTSRVVYAIAILLLLLAFVEVV